MSEHHSDSDAERPTELSLPTIPVITMDSDDDSSPSKHIASFVRRHESAKQAERAAATSSVNGDTSLINGETENEVQLASPEDSTLSGQDESMYREPVIDDDRRSTDTEASGPLGDGDSLADVCDETDFGRLPPPRLIPDCNKAVNNDDKQAGPETEPQATPEPVLTENEKRERKVRNIVQEVVDTERAYVSKLELIHNGFYEEFRERNKREQTAGSRPIVTEDTLQKVFRNVREIWSFHSSALLPALTACLSNDSSSSNPAAPSSRVGAVLKKFAPFFKMYTEYTTNYDADMRLLNAEMKRNERFAQILAEIQRRPQCGMLTLQQHMLEPIQRIPRYELLLSSYLKYLPTDDADRIEAEAALKLVREAVQKGEMRMKGSEEFKRMLELSEIFAKDVPDLIQPTRSLIKEGKVFKVSARNENERSERYLFLFNDLLLVCTQIPFSSAEAYKLHGASLKTEGMDVRLVSEADVPGFTALPNVLPTQRIALKTTQRHIEFAIEEEEDRSDWLAAFQGSARTHKATACVVTDGPVPIRSQVFIPGREAPKWIRDSEATMCMVCGAPFSVMTRRHHCRSCGHLICSNCSQYRIPLLYTGDLTKLHRACRQCYDLDRAIRARSQAGTMLPRPTRAGQSYMGSVYQPAAGSHLSISPGVQNLSIASSEEHSFTSASDSNISSQQSTVQRTSSNTSNVSQQSASGRRPSGDQLPASPASGTNTSSIYGTPTSTPSVYGGLQAPTGPTAASSPRRDAAGDPALLKAYAMLSADHGRSWERRFLAVRDDFAIYIYKAHADIYTRDAIPLPGYKVNKMKEKERVNAFKLIHPSGHVKSFLIQLNDQSLFMMWIEALEHLVCARLPPNAASSM